MSFSVSANSFVASSATSVKSNDVSQNFFGKTFQLLDPKHYRCLFAINGTAAEGSCLPPQQNGNQPSNLSNGGNSKNNLYYSNSNQIKLYNGNVCLDAPVRANGAGVKSATCNGSLGQKWKIISYTSGALAKLRYNIATNDLRYCLSWVDGQGQNYSLKECAFDHLQHFEFAYLNNPNATEGVILNSKYNLAPGAYNFKYNESQSNLMILNKRMKSYNIPDGWTVRFYEGTNLTGKYYTRTGMAGHDKWVFEKIQSFEILSKN